ncbi:aldolase/citrate lyase family protein [Dactylosporangium sp. NPDC051484]|uniref:HpcH/HpaI aldolase family protein n=1 Tax=Dactylosporangium sp. NPDC051484 TaxID=3154942 RepID=UPI00345110E3
MRDNRLLSSLRAGEASIGTLMTIPDLLVAEVMGNAGVDFLAVDTEHSPMTTEQLHGVLTALYPTESTVLVRVPAHGDVYIKQALDLGAEGVIVPSVNTAAECRTAVASARYAPVGSRGFGPRRASRLHGDRADYLARANGQIAVLAMIETGEAVEAIDEILATGGLDGIMVGPFDLAVSLGHLGDPEHPAVEEAIQKVLVACQGSGVPFGIFSNTPAATQKWVSRGALIATLGSDLQYLDAGIARTKADLAAVKGASRKES